MNVYKTLYNDNLKTKKINFVVGDRVCITKEKKLFKKGYLPNWTEEIFIVQKIDNNNNPPLYHLKDENNITILGRFYQQELQKMRGKFFKNLIKCKTFNGKNIYFIKWETYLPEWVDSDTYHKYKKRIELAH